MHKNSDDSQELPQLLTVKETAAYLRIPIPTVYYLVGQGMLPAIQIGGRWRLKRDLLDEQVLRQDRPRDYVVVLGIRPKWKIACRQALRQLIGISYQFYESLDPVRALAERNGVQIKGVLIDSPEGGISREECARALAALEPQPYLVMLLGEDDRPKNWGGACCFVRGTPTPEVWREVVRPLGTLKKGFVGESAGGGRKGTVEPRQAEEGLD